MKIIDQKDEENILNFP